ncbi:O-antigen ligase family protein [Spirosoma pollinicola]|nr:O-antigen ligase family protein [Spirosoma pollinicola]
MYSQFLSMCGFLFLFRIGKDETRKIIYKTVIFLIVVTVIFMTGGRAGFLGLCGGIFLLTISSKAKFRIFIFTVCVFSYLVINNFPQAFVIFNRSEAIDDSFNIRSRIWSEAYQTFELNPIWGVGVGQYENYNLLNYNYLYNIVNDKFVYYGTESGYLKILAECGILGFIIIFIIILLPIIKSVKFYIRKKVNYNIMFLIAGIIAWMIAFITSNTLDDKRIVVLLSTMLCLLILAEKLANNKYVHKNRITHI